MSRLLCVFGAVWYAAIAAGEQTTAKRLVLHDFGGPHRIDPVFVVNQLPYLESLPIDGVAILVSRANGIENISALAMQPAAVSLSRMSAVLAPLAGLDSTTLQRNFALLYFGPGFDVYDDYKWAISAENMTNFAAALKAAALTGIFFDNENYSDYADWRAGSPSCDARFHSLDACQEKMRERGGQIMRALQSAFPEIVVMFLHDAYTSDRTFFDQNRNLPNVDAANELLGPFLVGFAEAKGETATVVQGGENAGARTFEDFDALYQYSKYTIVANTGVANDAFSRAVRSNGSGFVPVALRARWPSLWSVATEIRSLDNIDAAGNPKSGFAETVASALARTDEYCWLYMDVPGRGALHTSMLEPVGSGSSAATQAFVDAVREGRSMHMDPRFSRTKKGR